MQACAKEIPDVQLDLALACANHHDVDVFGVSGRERAKNKVDSFVEGEECRIITGNRVVSNSQEPGNNNDDVDGDTDSAPALLAGNGHSLGRALSTWRKVSSEGRSGDKASSGTAFAVKGSALSGTLQLAQPMCDIPVWFSLPTGIW